VPVSESGEAGSGEAGEWALPRRGWLWLGPLAALTGAAFALLYDSDNGLRAVFRIRDELDRAQARIGRLYAERSDLVSRSERLRADPFEIERVARESLGMVRPGEIVVRLRAAEPEGN
jgi:cell division protein FtsB